MSKLEIQPKKYPPQCMGCSKNPHIILVDKLFPKFAIQDPGQSLKRLNLSQRNMRCYCVCAHVYVCVRNTHGGGGCQLLLSPFFRIKQLR